MAAASLLVSLRPRDPLYNKVPTSFLRKRRALLYIICVPYDDGEKEGEKASRYSALAVPHSSSSTVLLVYTTTAAPIQQLAPKPLWRLASLWMRNLGPSFSLSFFSTQLSASFRLYTLFFSASCFPSPLISFSLFRFFFVFYFPHLLHTYADSASVVSFSLISLHFRPRFKKEKEEKIKKGRAEEDDDCA